MECCKLIVDECRNPLICRESKGVMLTPRRAMLVRGMGRIITELLGTGDM